ncbi:hypothetical protein Athai_15530 [Actinocatenispora thailandica]|uniref:Uncharacterized protein n=1 Tax=Actinocatenispora thailandica TaxID=227318 RepID=A0A7R7DLT8_9ACTN|nr:hypothetical protein Athai_15530 [Actinocatenispora thailandica]
MRRPSGTGPIASPSGTGRLAHGRPARAGPVLVAAAGRTAGVGSVAPRAEEVTAAVR